MRVFLSGGCKMGKSTLAQRIAVTQGGSPFYVATMTPRDAEDEARVLRHQRERAGMGFTTVECPSGIERVLQEIPRGASVLLDSTTALLAEEMFSPDGAFDEIAPERVRDALLGIVDAYADIVIVSDFIYSDACRYDAMTEAYRRGLAVIDHALAARCDTVIEMTFGQRIVHKGWLSDAV